ncbi:hypothetical protein SCE1572_20030 [Sorangium cellulosum So0157-2]|uniref:Uncharacterized protein n=1 Tax=Sorangium cellulosum So0157-2 TaxID=1254432 RepID=S4XXF9_SORCE|nr:hypothetical protein SCE1572_20030 [Sorangium cellulosum So0157-2]
MSMMLRCRMRFTARASPTKRETTVGSDANRWFSTLIATRLPMSGCSPA